MKKIQIEQDLFVQMVKYFYSDELGFDDDDVCELYHDIKKGIDKILKKIGEESTEVIIAAKADDKAETIYEIADLAYHISVMMVEMGISVEDVRKELASRHVIDHKVKQEKMTGSND